MGFASLIGNPESGSISPANPASVLVTWAEPSDDGGAAVEGYAVEVKVSWVSNAAKNIFGNMYDLGIVDPAKVTRSGLQNATSIASMILTTECIIVDKDQNLNEG